MEAISHRGDRNLVIAVLAVLMVVVANVVIIVCAMENSESELWWTFGVNSFQRCRFQMTHNPLMIANYASEEKQQEVISKYCLTLQEVVEECLDDKAFLYGEKILEDSGGFEEAHRTAMSVPYRHGAAKVVRVTVEWMVNQLADKGRLSSWDLKQQFLKEFHAWWLDVCAKKADKYWPINSDGEERQTGSPSQKPSDAERHQNDEL